MAATRESYLAIPLRIEAVEIADVGTFCVREMDGPDFLSWQRLVDANNEDGRGNMHHLLARCLCDEQGNRLFKDDEAEEVGRKPASIMFRLCNVALRLNFLTTRTVEEVKKN